MLTEFTPPATEENERVIDARNAFVMNSLLQEVTRSGTAARAQATLKRPDLYGKTGTTNDAWDAWFAGFQLHSGGRDLDRLRHPRNLESRNRRRPELAGLDQLHGKALKGVPVMEPTVPPGLVNVAGEWYYEEVRTQHRRNPASA